MSSTATLQNPRSPSLERRVEAFEAAYAGGASVDILRFLPSVNHPAYLDTVCELIRVGLELGWETGRPQRVAEYRAMFPDVFARPDLADAILLEERRLRERHGTCAIPAGPGSLLATRVVAAVPVAVAVDSSVPSTFGGAGPERILLPQVGEEFLGFRLVEELGTGSFGSVFLAHQRGLSDRPVALKVTAQPNREAQHLARFQHTNIMPVLSVHQRGPVQAVCMPYFGRATLRQVLGSIRRHESLPMSGEGLVSTLRASAHDTVTEPHKAAPKETAPASQLGALAPTPTRDMLAKLGYVDAVVWLAARLADGLAHAHERGVLHRDLKPENVLLADDGQPMLLDFNLADDAAGRAAHCGGTLLYMAPEHLAAFAGDRARTVDARSDLYALGLLLYELLTTRHPSPLPPRASGTVPTSPVQALREARGAAPASVRHWNPAISPAVGAVVAKLLEPEPARRYQSARHLQEDLERHLANLPLRHGREPSVRERARKFVRRNPRAVPLAGLTVAVALIGFLGTVVIDRNRDRAAAEARAIESARAEADAREGAEVRTRFAEFSRNVQDARVLLTVGANDPAIRNAGVARASAALALYEAETAPEWATLPAVRRLSDHEQDALQVDVAEVRFLLTRAAGNANARDTAKVDRPTPERARNEYLDGAGRAVAGRWAEAVPALERACRRDPQHLAAAFTLGYCLQALGRDAEALESYRACIALRPDFPWSYLNRGVVYQKRGDHARALADFDDAVRLGPTWADAYFTRGTLYQQTGKNREALADFDRAEALKTPRARLFILRAQVKLKLDDPDGAARDRAKAFATPPSDEFDHLALGLALLPAEPDKALAAFDRAQELNPRSLPAMQNRAYVLSEFLKRGPDAVNALDALVEQYPAFVKGRGGRAVLHARLGDRAAAHRDAAECLRRDSSPSTLYQLAGVYALTSKADPGDRREALRLLAAALTAGFRDFATLDRDPDLNSLRTAPEFIALVAEFRSAVRANSPPEKK